MDVDEDEDNAGEDDDGEKEGDEDDEMEDAEGDENAGPSRSKNKGKRKKGRKSEFNMETLENEAVAVAVLQSDQLQRARLERKYYSECLTFIRQIESGMKIIEELLASNSKAEVLEAIDFFRVVHEYQFDGAEVCTETKLPSLSMSDRLCHSGRYQENASSHLVQRQFVHVGRWQGAEGYPTASHGVLPQPVLRCYARYGTQAASQPYCEEHDRVRTPFSLED